MPYKEGVTLERVKEVLDYNQDLGEFRWKVRLSRNVPPGKKAGSSKGRNGFRYIRIDDVEYSAARLAWYYVNGKWPQKLKFLDDNPANIRIDNLVEQNSLPKKYDHSTPEGRSAYMKEHRRRYLENYRKSMLLKKFGISKDDYEKMHRSQNGLCAICSRPETRTRKGRLLFMAVDHHHESGKVRDLLCSACNVLIGYAKEDVGVLESAISYLKRHQSVDIIETVP